MIPVEDGARFPLGNGEILILHTPGHTLDSICILYGDACSLAIRFLSGRWGGLPLKMKLASSTTHCTGSS